MLPAHDDSRSIRESEILKYHRAYQHPHYRMGQKRMHDAIADLAALPNRGSLLDIGCGRGEMMDHAEELGFAPVCGLEAVPELCADPRVTEGRATDLPFGDRHFDVVTLWDVIEHLPRGDDETVCREMARVARCHILLTANNRPSKNHVGDELHINRRPYPEWDDLFRSWFSRSSVTWIRGHRQYVSECWRIDL